MTLEVNMVVLMLHKEDYLSEIILFTTFKASIEASPNVSNQYTPISRFRSVLVLTLRCG